MIIVDEAHHSAASSWQKVIDRFPKAKIIHLTATPFRSDRQEIDGELVFRYSFPLFGWKLAGLAGLFAATLGILGPSSLLALALARKLRRDAEAPWLKRLKAALIPLALGLMAANGFILARAADATALAALITFASAAFVVYSSRSPLWAMAAGALLAVAAGRLGI